MHVMPLFHRRVRVGSVWVVRERYCSGRLRLAFPPPTLPLWWAGFKPDRDSRGGYHGYHGYINLRLQMKLHRELLLLLIYLTIALVLIKR